MMLSRSDPLRRTSPGYFGRGNQQYQQDENTEDNMSVTQYQVLDIVKRLDTASAQTSNANTEVNIQNKPFNKIKRSISHQSYERPQVPPRQNYNQTFAQKSSNVVLDRSTAVGIEENSTAESSKPLVKPEPVADTLSHVTILTKQKEAILKNEKVDQNVKDNIPKKTNILKHPKHASKEGKITIKSKPLVKPDPEVTGSEVQYRMEIKGLPPIIEQTELKQIIHDSQSLSQLSMKSSSISRHSSKSVRSFSSKVKSLPRKFKEKVIVVINGCNGDSASKSSMESLQRQMDNVSDKMDNVTDVVNTSVNENSKNLHVAINKPCHLNAKEFADCYYYVNLFSYVATLINKKTYKTFVAKMLHRYSDSFIEQEIKQLKENSTELRKDSKIDKYEKRVTDFLWKWMRSYAYPEDMEHIEHTLKDALITVNKNFEGVNLFKGTPQYQHTSAEWLEEKKLHNLSKMFTEEYQSIGFDLGFTRARLQQFQADNPYNVVGRNSDMLIGWKNKQNPSVSDHMMKGELIKAFTRAERNDLVKKLDG